MRIHVLQLVIAAHKRFAALVAFVRLLAGVDAHVGPQVVVAAEPLVAHRTVVRLLAGVYQPMAVQMLDAAERAVAAFAFVLLLVRVRPNVLAHLALAHPFAALRTAGRLRVGRLEVLGEHGPDEETGSVVTVVGGAGRWRMGGGGRNRRRRWLFVFVLLCGGINWARVQRQRVDSGHRSGGGC